MVQHRGLDPARWRWDANPNTFADWLASLPKSGEEGCIAEVVHRQAVVSSGRAGFQSVPGAHHGIGADVYGRFTAPMREIVGIYLHGEGSEALGAKAVGPIQSHAANELRDRVIAAAEGAANHQKALDREANRIVLDQVMAQDLGHGQPQRAGTLMGLGRRKLYVRLQDPPLDIKVYLHHLEAQSGQRMRVDEQEVQLLEGGKTRLALGDEVLLRVMGQDADADRWVFHLVGASG